MTLRYSCALLAVSLLTAGSAQAQTPPTPERPTIGAVVDAEVVKDLPTGGSVLSLLETMQPETIGDRFYTGGLSTGQAGRIGGFLSSPAQTVFRIDDVDVTDPGGSGTPLLFPGLLWWQRVVVSPGLMPADVNAPGLAVTMTPRRPTAAWTRTIEATGAPSPWVSDPSSRVPAISRLDNWANGAVVASGPLLANKVGAVFGGSWTRGSQFNRGGTVPVSGDVESGFAHFVVRATPRDEVRALAWVQRAEAPFADRLPATSARDVAVHSQSTWERRLADGGAWRVFGGFTQRNRTLDVALPAAGSLIVERLADGPVPELAETGNTSSRRLSIGGRFAPAPRTLMGRRHALQAGVDVEQSTSTTSPDVIGIVGELVDGGSARAWSFHGSGKDSHRGETAVAVYVGDEVVLGARSLLTGALRYDTVRGSAEGAASRVSWGSLLPSVSIRSRLTERMRVVLFGSYARSAYRLPLRFLAYGDPAAPVADVFQWAGGTPAAAVAGTPVVARVGPGVRSDASFSGIDPNLKRTTSDEIVIGVESHPSDAVRLSLAGITKWERNSIAVENVGVGASDYSLSKVDDPGTLPGQPIVSIPIYNRLPASFGRDRYELTNPDIESPRVVAIDFVVQAKTDRMLFVFGGTAQRSFAPAASRGFHATENDQGTVGELLTDPNATTFGDRVRPFTDRAYTAKASLVYKLPKDIRFGTIARYQDGQPFAGVVVVRGLNQGAEAVRAFADGGTRFTYTATLDVRLQKEFSIGTGRVSAFVDVYNLTGHHHEVEERTVLGADFRTMTAIQPPRAVHLGARLTF